MKYEYDPALLDSGLKRLTDMRSDLAVQAAKELDAKVLEAVHAAFDDGMDFVRDRDVKLSSPDPFSARSLFDPWVHTISYRGGPIAPDLATPADMIRYARPKDWQRGRKLR